MKKVLISPSLLSFDFANVGQQAVQLIKDGADMLHLDVMDGVFVPNITFGAKFVADINKVTDATLDVHLMIVNPINYIDQFVKAGADIITIHYEATEQVRHTLSAIRQRGVKAGLSIKPSTPVSVIAQYIDIVDLVLIMSVEPGFGGQSFIVNSLQRIAQTKQLIGNRDIILQVDGGINRSNASSVISAGADCLVAGSAIYNEQDHPAVIRALRRSSLTTMRQGNRPIRTD
ncbi:MAG: ribulose-phosphate 3-epimerase [Clostridia bacterium]|nr:ribulose-phosphate 3-epimerase [Clostridia bacterium]